MSDHCRFFVGPDRISGDTVSLDGPTARQIVKVLRLGRGDRIVLLDGLGSECLAEIADASVGEVTAKVISRSVSANEPRLQLALAVCLPKNDKLDLIVQKCTELGISELMVVHSERSVARVDGSKAADRLARWRRIAAEAVEQCGRARVPEICGPVDFSDMVGMIDHYALRLLAWEEEDQASLGKVLRENAGAESALLIVGPEGGLTRGEAESAKAAGALSVSLGRRLLRSDTAAIAACAAIMYELEGEL